MGRGLAAGRLQVAWQWLPGKSWTCGWGIRCLEGLERRAQELHAGLPSLVLGVAVAHRWIAFEQNHVAAEAVGLKQGECGHQLGSAATQAPGRGWGIRRGRGGHCREEWGGRGSLGNHRGSYHGHRRMSRRDSSWSTFYTPDALPSPFSRMASSDPQYSLGSGVSSLVKWVPLTEMKKWGAPWPSQPL